MTEPVSFPGALKLGAAGLAAMLLLSVQVKISAQQSGAASAGSSSSSSQRQFLDRYCATCHNERLKSGGLSLAQIDVSRPGAQPELWEKVVRKLHTGVMPPPNMPQPSDADRHAILTWLETSLDAASAAKPNPGRTETLRRLNRTEYQNAIRDLLALDIDAASLLPADESGHGFDNVNVGDLLGDPPESLHLGRQKISRLAVGSTQSLCRTTPLACPADLTQEDQLPGMPIGTRGGVSTSYTFAQDGEYEDPDLAHARSGGSRQRIARGPSARDAGAARPGAGPDLHRYREQPSATKS
jgi:mono/diheme cytochrome c family protein